MTEGTVLFLLLGGMDIVFTIDGLDGNPAMEGNPLLRGLMENYGILTGLLFGKTGVLLIAVALSLIAARGISRNSNWVYYLALTKLTRNWMKQKKRFWVAFLPLYLIAAAQGLAALSWIMLKMI